MEATSIIRLQAEGPAGQGLTPLALDAADFQSPLPEQHWHVYFNDPASGLIVGVWTTTDMHEVFGPYPGDEFMLLLDGRVALLDEAGGETLVQAGQAFTVANATPTSWKQVGPCRKFFVIHDPPGHAAAPGAGIGILDPMALAGHLARHGTGCHWPGQRQTVAFASDTGAMTAGLRQGPGFSAREFSASAHELICLTAGTLQATAADGRAQSFGPGDVFFVPAGTRCDLKARDPISLLFCRVAAP